MIDRYETLFLGGLKPNLTKSDLLIHFSKYGELVDISIKVDPHTGCNKGFAFILYKDSSVIKRVLAEPQILDGRSVECKISFGGRHNQQDRYEASKCKLFVSNLHISITNSDLFEHFKRYGELRHAYVIYHPSTGVSRGFGYIHYQKKESVEKALQAEGANSSKSFKCERYSMNVKKDQEKKRKMPNQDNESSNFTSFNEKPLENRSACKKSPRQSQGPPKSVSPTLQDNQGPIDTTPENSVAIMDHSGQFAPNTQTFHQNGPFQHTKTMAPRNYAGTFAKPSYDQDAYQPHPQQSHPLPRCNTPPFYPTDMMYSQGVYQQSNQYFQPQYQNFQPMPQYQQQQDCRQHYARMSEPEQQKMMFYHADAPYAQFVSGSGTNSLPDNSTGCYTNNSDYMNGHSTHMLAMEPKNYADNAECYGQDAIAYEQNMNSYYYNPSLPAENFGGPEFYFGQEWSANEEFENYDACEKDYQKAFMNCNQGANAFNLNSFNPRQGESSHQAFTNPSPYMESADRGHFNKSLNSLRLFTTKMKYIQGEGSNFMA
jgi:RNA recognition motif-containing protein